MGRIGNLMWLLSAGIMLAMPLAAQDEADLPTDRITAEEVGVWVQEPDFAARITKMPELAALLARYPCAANVFYLRSDFGSWAERFPASARIVTEAALRWQDMNDAEKENFYARHPGLRPIAGLAQGDDPGRQQRERN